MDVDFSSIRPGDRVAVWSVVSATDGKMVRLRPQSFCGAGGEQWASFDLIAAHEPQPLGPNTPVKYVGNPVSIRGRIRHIIGDKAWVAWSSDSGGWEDVTPLSRLERESRP